jgi:CRISPR/Cas system CSM-associated protein Csm5 (group 7 of RAMP superfamily)
MLLDVWMGMLAGRRILKNTKSETGGWGGGATAPGSVDKGSKLTAFIYSYVQKNSLNIVIVKFNKNYGRSERTKIQILYDGFVSWFEKLRKRKRRM